MLDTTVCGILRTAAEEAPDTPALAAGVADPGGRRAWSYAELWAEAERAAGALAQRFAPGERLAVWAGGVPAALVASYAAARAGLVLVPVNPALRRAELTYVLGQSAAAGVLVGGEHRGVDLPAVLASVRPDLPALRHVIPLGDWDDLVAGGGAVPAAEPGPDDVAQLVYTSGTTGAPKGARLTHRGLTNAGRFGAARFGMVAGDVYVMTMPLFHVGGQVVSFQLCQAAATNVLMPAFDPGLHLELLETYRATLTAGVPTMLLALIDHPDFPRRDLAALRSVSSGGAVVPPELVRFIESRLGVRFTIAYGQTETCGFIAQTHLDDRAEDKAETLGRLGVELAGELIVNTVTDEESTGAGGLAARRRSPISWGGAPFALATAGRPGAAQRQSAIMVDNSVRSRRSTARDAAELSRCRRTSRRIELWLWFTGY